MSTQVSDAANRPFEAVKEILRLRRKEQLRTIPPTCVMAANGLSRAFRYSVTTVTGVRAGSHIGSPPRGVKGVQGGGP